MGAQCSTTSSTNTTMKLLMNLLVIALFFTAIFAIPVQKGMGLGNAEEECDEESAPMDYEPALGLPDLVIDLRENIVAIVEEEDCDDEIVTEEPEVLQMVTEECEEEPITEEPATEAAPLVTESCVDDFTTEATTEEEPTPEPTAAAAAAVEVTSECADEEIVEELPVIFEMALPDEEEIVEEECEE